MELAKRPVGGQVFFGDVEGECEGCKLKKEERIGEERRGEREEKRGDKKALGSQQYCDAV